MVKGKDTLFQFLSGNPFYYSVFKLPFLGKVVGSVSAPGSFGQNRLPEPLSNWFRPGLETEAALVAFTDSLHQGMDSGN